MASLRAVRIVHPFPSSLVAGTTTVIALFAGGCDRPRTTAMLAGGMLAYQFAIGVLNDLADAPDDRRTRPDKPMTAGLVDTGRARALFGACFAAGVLLTLPLGPAAWLIGLAGAGCGFAYDLGLKRTNLSWLPFSLAFPLVPVWVAVALDKWEPVLWAVLPLGAVLGFAIHLANQAPDLGLGTGGFVERLGARRARFTAVVLVVGVAGTVAALRFPENPTAALLSGGIGLAAAGVGPFADRVPGRLFGVLSLAAAGLAGAFLSLLA